MPEERQTKSASTTELALSRTELAYERSRLASDRTTMGYLRTAISLVGFGFSIPTFFQVLSGMPGFEASSATPPRILGVSLLLVAVLMLVSAIFQQALFLKKLEKATQGRHPFSIALASCIVVLTIALAATGYIALQIGKS